MPMRIFQLSSFVANQFKKYPQLISGLDKSLDIAHDWHEFQAQNSHYTVFSLLRSYRQRTLALIAAQDDGHPSTRHHLHTLHQTSQLAKTLIHAAFSHAQNEIQQKYGHIYHATGLKQSFVVFALGKLGGNELNYSSDVDLVFCYSGNGQSDGAKCVDAQTYYTKLGRKIIQLLHTQTNDGIVYRVDMRLRPFGSAAPLVCSKKFLLEYFETEGRDWERYAWLRASYAAGDEELAQSILASCEAFIYRKYLDYSVFASLRQIKQQIQRQQFEDEENLKLGRGGIREIEFIVQTLQLTFAGRNKQLRGNDLYQQLHNLGKFNHLTAQQVATLSAAWLFLRRLENLCQIIHDRDSHHLPKDKRLMQNLAYCLDFEDVTAFLQQLQTHRQKVHQIFDQLFLSNKNTSKTTTEQNIHPQIQKIKDEIAKKNYPKSNKHKLYATWDALSQILPEFQNDTNLIQDFQKVINAVSKRVSYLSMLIESPLILRKMLTQLSHGAYFSDAIAKMPSLLEVLFEGLSLSDLNAKKQWQLFVNKHNINDAEQHIELLCQFKQQMHFKLNMALVEDIINKNQAGVFYTELAQLILSHVIKLAWQQTAEHIKSLVQHHDLIVIAYGSMAVKTMQQSSDFDLVFVLNQSIDDKNHRFIVRWIKKIIHYLAIQTYFGRLYELDTQLRPNGNSGAAIVSKHSFENYQMHEAWVWEHAALIKSRAVFATEQQKKWFQKVRKKVLCQKREAQLVRSELQKMAEKLSQEGKKNHHHEFEKLGDILIQAQQNPQVIKINSLSAC